jgi:hypothetical protein
MTRVDPAVYVWTEKFEPDDIARRKQTKAFDKMSRDWERIFAWSLNLARELWQSVPEWANEKYIGAHAWEVKFPHSAAISEQMLLRMSGFESMASLKEAIEIQEQGNESTTETSPADSDSRTFFQIPGGIAEMTDEEIGVWSEGVYTQFMSASSDTLAEKPRGRKK